MALLTRLLESNTRHWGVQLADDLIGLVNANVRVPNGYTVVQGLNGTTMAGSGESWQWLAEDMAALGVTVEEDPDYTVSLRTLTQRTDATRVYGCTEVRFTRTLNGGGADRLDTASMPTAAQIYSYVVSSGLFSIYPAVPRVYIAVGIGEVPWTDLDPFPQTMYFSVYMLDGTSNDIPGFGLVEKPKQAFTPATNEAFTQVNTVLWGETWHAQFLEFVNEQRAFLGLPPYLLPTRQIYLDWLDIAQIHANNQVDVRRWYHDDPAYPEGYRTFEERVLQLGKASGENILRSRMLGIYDPRVQTNEDGQYRIGDVDLSYQIVNDTTLLTPEKAFIGWWNSGGHRQNMMRNWKSETVYSFMGFGLGLFATSPASSSVAPNVELYLVNVFSVLESAVAERTLYVDYQIVGANILTQNATFRLDALTKVRVEHQSVHSLRLGHQHAGDYGCRVGVQHVAPIHYGVQSEMVAGYTQTMQLIADHGATYRITDKTPVQKDFDSPYSIRIAQPHKAVYEQPPRVTVVHKALYAERARVFIVHQASYEVIPRVLIQHRSQWTDAVTLAARLTIKYALNAGVKTDHRARYELLTYVKADHAINYNVMALNPVIAQNRSLWAMLNGATRQVAASASLVLPNGRSILITDAVVSADEDQYAWQASIRIPSISDYVLISEGDLISLVLGGEPYSLMVTSRSLSRDGPASMDMRIAAMSPTVTLDEPRAPPIDLSVSTPMMAKDIVEMVLGRAVVWELVNWQIPAYRVQFTQTTPMGIARAVVASAGGVIQTGRDGSVIARPRFPVTLSQAQLVAPDQILNEVEDLLDVSEEYEYHSGNSRFRIREGETTFGDRLDWVPDEGSKTVGVLRVLPSPWRTNFTIDCTDSPNVTEFTDNGEVLRQEQEQVEFKAGVAVVSYPIHSLDSVEWYSDSLGSLVFSPYSTSLTGSMAVNEGYGLALVTYTTRAIEYKVIGSTVPVVQFVMKEGIA